MTYTYLTLGASGTTAIIAGLYIGTQHNLLVGLLLCGTGGGMIGWTTAQADRWNL